MSKFIYKHQKTCVIILTIVFILSLIPMLIIAGYDAAAGDDYNFGAMSHLTYASSGSVWLAIKAAKTATVNTWRNWQGTWFDCFLFCLHPEVFSDSAYVIVPYIFIIIQILAFLLFAHHFISEKWQIKGPFWLITGLIYLLFVFQLVPSQKSAFFWWVGCIHYAMPICLALTGLVLGDRFLMHHKAKDMILLCFISAAIGGATYPAALLLMLGTFLLWLAKFVLGKKKEYKDILLLIPFALEMIGLIISVIAPGNAARSASDMAEGAVPSGGAVMTILKSIAFSVQDALGYFIAEKTFVLIEFICTGIITWIVLSNIYENADDNSRINYRKLFSHPLLFVVVMFLLNASMYAPRLYAGGVVSSGYFNFNFWVFTLCCTGCIIYLLGWIVTKEITLRIPAAVVYPILIATALLIVFCGRHGVKNYTDYICLEYYLSGQAQDYKDQIALQRLLMEEDGVDDVVLPGINNEQGPLMHMPVVADPENIDNKMTSKFYGKKSCRAIPREEWMEKYGEQYGY